MGAGRGCKVEDEELSSQIFFDAGTGQAVVSAANETRAQGPNFAWRQKTRAVAPDVRRKTFV